MLGYMLVDGSDKKLTTDTWTETRSSSEDPAAQ